MDKIWQRMVKEARLHAARKGVIPLSDAVTDWLAKEGRTEESTALATRVLHRQSRLPWPLRKGWIASEYHDDPAARSLLLIHRHPGQGDFLPDSLRPCHVDATDIVDSFNVHWDKGKAISIYPHTYMLFHATADNVIARRMCYAVHESTKPHHAHLRREVPREPPVWVAQELAPTREQQHAVDHEQHVDLATNILACLANLAVPCGYRLKRHDRKGFGTRKQRRITRGQTMMWHCGWNRVHELALAADHPMANYTGPVSGHWKTQWFRDTGHYAWEYPTDPVERQRLKEALHVGEVYCPPFWMGPKLIETPDAVYEACLDEVQLSCWLDEKAAMRNSPEMVTDSVSR